MKYPAYFSSEGTPAPGLTPTWTTLRKVSDGTEIAGGARPAITEVGNGWYATADYTPAEDLVGVLDAGVSLGATDRYVPVYITAYDQGVKTIVDKLPSKSYLTGTANSDGDLEADAVTGNLAGTVTLADNGITAAKIASDAITDAKIASGALTSAKFASGAFDAVWTVTTRSLTTFGTLVADIWANGTRTLSSFGSLTTDTATSVWAAGSRTLTSFGTLVSDIWSAGTRTLTTFGSLVADIWTYATRTITSGGITAQEVRDAMKLAPSPGVPPADSIDALIDAVPTAAEIDTVLSASHGAGEWGGGSATVDAQDVRDAMALALSDGVPIAPGSVDDKLAAASAEDPLENAVPGSYAPGTAGYQLARIGSTNATVNSPTSQTDNILTIIRGDDYAVANGRQIAFTFSGAPSITGALVVFSAGLSTVFSKTLTVTGPAAAHLELTSAETERWAAGNYRYDVQATLPNGTVITLINRAKLIVAQDVR